MASRASRNSQGSLTRLRLPGPCRGNRPKQLAPVDPGSDGVPHAKYGTLPESPLERGENVVHQLHALTGVARDGTHHHPYRFQLQGTCRREPLSPAFQDGQPGLEGRGDRVRKEAVPLNALVHVRPPCQFSEGVPSCSRNSCATSPVRLTVTTSLVPTTSKTRLGGLPPSLSKACHHPAATQSSRSFRLVLEVLKHAGAPTRESLVSHSVP